MRNAIGFELIKFLGVGVRSEKQTRKNFLHLAAHFVSEGGGEKSGEENDNE